MREVVVEDIFLIVWNRKLTITKNAFQSHLDRRLMNAIMHLLSFYL